MKLIGAGSLRRYLISSLTVLFCLQRALSVERECDFGLKVLWSAKLRDSPLTAMPLLFDVDKDGYNDIVVPSFSGEVWAVHGESGHIVDNWPFYLEERAFHASPLLYDLNEDGSSEFILTTTDAELVFLQSDNTLLHGETIKVASNQIAREIPPLRVKRYWYQEDPEDIKKLVEQMSQQLEDDDHFSIKEPKKRSTISQVKNLTKPYSEFESKFGRFADPLYSTHQPEHPPSGVDRSDENFVFVDPHVLATPALTDINGDGERNELVVPVSYYFDPMEYGRTDIGKDLLNGMEKDELVNFVAGGIVIVDLKQRRISNQKVIKITKASSDQPGYILATPTIVKLSQGMVIIFGSATGELHVLKSSDLSPLRGFPLRLDSISSQVAVGDVFGTGAMNMIVGDNSGNVYCISENGERVWEQETNIAIVSSIRLADLEKDGKIEVIVATQSGALWILNGQDGSPYPPNYPMHLNAPMQASPLLLHMNATSKNGRRRTNSLAVVLATSESIYIVDALTMCMDKFESEHMFMEVLANDIDPYSPGLELLAISLDGYMVCFTTASSLLSELDSALESWAGEAIGQNGFTHKSDSFALVLPHANHTARDISGSSFALNLQIYQRETRSNDYTVEVSIGRFMTLHKSVVSANQKITDVSLTIPTPPSPLQCFVTVQICNKHAQCNSQSYVVKFNLHFEDDLKWLLALPFLFLCVFILWAYRNVSVESLPTSSIDSRKSM